MSAAGLSRDISVALTQQTLLGASTLLARTGTPPEELRRNVTSPGGTTAAGLAVFEDAGFRDIFAGPGLKLAEWPEKAAAVLPVPDLSIHLDAQADGSRQVTVCAHTARGLELLA